MDDQNAPLINARGERLDRLAGTRGRNTPGQAVTAEELAAQVADNLGDLNRRIVKSQSAALGADVALSTSGQWYDGPSVGLKPGIYMLTAQALHRNDAATAASVVQARIFDGTNALAALQASIAATSGLCTPFALVAPIVVTRNMVVTLQMRASVGHASLKMKATAPDAGSGLVATRLFALRIGD